MSLFEALKKAHREGRLPHALLLSYSSDAYQKFSKDRHDFVEFLLGESVFDSHPDYLKLNPETQTKGYAIDQLEDFFRRIHLKANRSPWRVFIFEEAEHLSSGQASAANALLKVLEEPQDSTLFLMCSHKPLSVLSTIRSRCQHFRYIGSEAPSLPSLEDDWKPLEQWLRGEAGLRPIPMLPLDTDKFWKDREVAQSTLNEIFDTLWKRAPEWWQVSLEQRDLSQWALDFFEDFQTLISQMKFYTNGSLQWASLRQRYL